MKQIELPFKKELKVGCRVEILGKSVGDVLSRSNVYKRGGGYGYVTSLNHPTPYPDSNVVLVDFEMSTTGDFFLPGDLRVL